MTAKTLPEEQIRRALARLPGWEFVAGQLRREYRFHDFVDAFAFMTAAALRIQEMDHHPEWSNVYGTVRIALWTHDAGGVTDRDLELALRLEVLATHRLPA